MEAFLLTLSGVVRELRAREVHRAFFSASALMIGTNTGMAALLEGLAPYELVPYLAVYVTLYAAFEFFFKVEYKPFAISREPEWGQSDLKFQAAWKATKRWIAAMAVSVVVIGGALLGLFTRNVWLYEGRTVVVRPFENVGTLQIDGYDLAAGIRDALASSSLLSVAPGVGAGLAPGAAGGERRDAKLPLVLSGTIAKGDTGGAVITATLQDRGSRGARTVYVRTVMEDDPSALLRVHGEIAEAVARQTNAWMLSLRRRQPASVAAARQFAVAYTRLQQSSARDIDAAIPRFMLAYHTDSTSLAAVSGLAAAHALRGLYVEDGADSSYARAVQLADQAIRRAGGDRRRDLAGAYAARGVVAMYRDRDLMQARVALRTALQMDNGFTPAYEHLAKLFLYQGRFADAQQSVAAGLKADSTVLALRVLRGQIPHFAGGDSASVRLLSQVIADEPCMDARGARAPMLRAYRTLGYALIAVGRAADAEDVYREQLVACRNARRSRLPLAGCGDLPGPAFTVLLARGMAANGNRAAGDSLVRCAKTQYARNAVPYEIALYHAATQAPSAADSVVRWLRIAEACAGRDVVLTIGVEPLLKPFRSDTAVVKLTRDVFDPDRARARWQSRTVPDLCR